MLIEDFFSKQLFFWNEKQFRETHVIFLLRLHFFSLFNYTN
jgi:hypothetical protein